MQERFASLDHSLEYNGVRFVQYVKSNPLQSMQKRVQATLQSWLLAYAEKAKTPAAGMPKAGRRSVARYDDAENDEEDVVTVTKIQFLEQQLAELRAMMSQAGPATGMVPPTPTAAFVLSSPPTVPAPPAAAPVVPVSATKFTLETAVPSPTTPGAGSPASDPVAPCLAAAAPSSAFASPSGRPNIVSLVAQAKSSVKLRCVLRPGAALVIVAVG